MLSLLLLVSLAAFSDASLWVGMSPEPHQPTNVSLFKLSLTGAQSTHLATILLTEPNEAVSIDSFRCRPYGTFCLTTSTNGTDSWLYNTTFANGKSVKTFVPGVVIHNLHVDLATGAAYTVALTPNSAVVTQILLGVITPLVDISDFVGDNQTVLPGATTQCSDLDIMWIYVSYANRSAPGIIVSVSLPQRKVLNWQLISGDIGFYSLWASCDDATDVNKMGGSALFNNGKSVGYGSLNSSNNIVFDASGSIPSHSPVLIPSGLLSESYDYDYFFTLYPEGTAPGGGPTSGYIVSGNFAGSSKLVFTPINYYLTGAAIQS